MIVVVLAGGIIVLCGYLLSQTKDTFLQALCFLAGIGAAVNGFFGVVKIRNTESTDTADFVSVDPAQKETE